MEERVLSILGEIGIAEEFEDSEDFLGDGLLDSFGVIALVGALEEEFKIEIDGEDIILENFNNVEAIVKLVNKLSAK